MPLTSRERRHPVDISDSPESSKGSERLLATAASLAAACAGQEHPPIYRIKPLEDGRWGGLLLRHEHSTVFHTTAWLSALQKTYRYEPVAFTTSAPGQSLDNALLLCRVESWLTGRRLVGVPFSDHCEPLVTCAEELEVLLSGAKREASENSFRYVEVRARRNDMSAALPVPPCVDRYWLHQIDLVPELDTIFGRLHKSSTQRKILRAGREGLEYAEGCSKSLLDDFYRLQILTRRRHKIPPQPFTWFRNLADSFGDALTIRVARKNGVPVGAMITIAHRDTLVFKYGCSDARFHKLGVMHALFWRAIQEAKQTGLRTFDLGRSDLDHEGLVTFKDRWGSQRLLVDYTRYEVPDSSSTRNPFSRIGDSARRICAHLPGPLLRTIGRFGYRHIG